MNKRYSTILAAAACLLASAAAWADNVVKLEGQNMGDIVQMTAQKVTIKQGAVNTDIPVNEIKAVYFSDEPATLKTARTAMDAGRYEDAVTALEKINVENVARAEIKQDIQFYTALAKARIALASADADIVVEAGRLMAAFVNANRDNYHYYHACEVVGDALVVTGNYSNAQTYYKIVGSAPWSDYQMRAGVALGQALLAEGKTAEALKSFQAVLDTEAASESADLQRLGATLGKARCLAETGSSDEAVKLVEGVIAKANPENVRLHAQAYNALGIAHGKAGRAKDALLAFLRVDVLYFNSPKEHIEALENLIELWPKVQEPDRAEDSIDRLRERYKRSPRSN